MLTRLLRGVVAAIKPTRQPSWCPVCNTEPTKFAPLPKFYFESARRYGFVHLENAEMLSLDTYSCCSCGASDRERLYAFWIDQQFKKDFFRESMHAIHFAPEAALSKKLKGLLSDYKTADLLRNDVDYNIDITDMPFEDEYFDFFLCSHVLEHVENDDRAIEELYRITKPGGYGILIAPIIINLTKTLEDPKITDEADRWRYYGQNDHVRLYAHDDYVKKIRSHGFLIEELDENYFGKELFGLLGLKQTSILYVVSK